MLNSSLKNLTIGLLSFLFIFFSISSTHAQSESASIPLPICTNFADVLPGNTFYPYIHVLSCFSVINGYACGGPGETCNANNDPYFRPGNNLTRGQGAQMVSNGADFQEDPGAQLFQDIPVGSTFFASINRLARRQIISGYECGGAGEPCVAPGNLRYFRQNAELTRGQLSKMTSIAAGYTEAVTGQTFQDIAPGSTFYDYVERLARRGIISGYTCGGAGEPCVAPGNKPYFRQNATVTRQQAAQFIAKAFFNAQITPNPTAPVISSGPTGTPGNCSLKAQGDADCNGVINNIDYSYYVVKVNGGNIPANVSPDFNADGEVGLRDRVIIIRTLSGGGGSN